MNSIRFSRQILTKSAFQPVTIADRAVGTLFKKVTESPKSWNNHLPSSSFSSSLPLVQSRKMSSQKLTSKDLIELESKYGAHNYHPIPVVFDKAKGVKVWDPEGKEYFDFLSAYSAVNQGHCHEKITKAIQDQCSSLTLSSRAFYNSKLGPWAKYVCEYFGYEKVLPMNTGAEAVETAIKLARKWGYEKKGIPKDEAIIIGAMDNFHGRTMAVISLSTSEETVKNFGPLLPNMKTIPYNDASALEKVLKEHGDKVAAFLIEPIQGEAGVVVPDEGYLKKCYELCKAHNVLFIDDEIQTGIARTGKLLCIEWDNVKPDVVILGKALSGGSFPVSAILSSSEIMSVFTPGTHGSTYGGNPVACAVSRAALEIVKDEKLVENARRMGEIFRRETQVLVGGIVKQIRGKGLLNAFVVDQNHPKMKGFSAYDICLMLKEKGLLAKQTHENVIRFAPPLVITEQQLKECINIIITTIREVENRPTNQ